MEWEERAREEEKQGETEKARDIPLYFRLYVLTKTGNELSRENER